MNYIHTHKNAHLTSQENEAYMFRFHHMQIIFNVTNIKHWNIKNTERLKVQHVSGKSSLGV